MATRVALVTGGASGIGEATAVLFAKNGYSVVISDVNVEGAEKVAKAIEDGGGSAAAVKHNVGDEESWKAAVAFTVATFGSLSTLVNNAGIGGPSGAVQNTTLDDYHKVINVTSTSVFLGMKTASAELFKQGSKASVVNISSVMGIVGNASGGFAGYSAAKGAVRSLTKNTAISWAKAKTGVRVNSVHPGYIDTPLVRGALSTEAYNQVVELHPIGRLGTPEEVAEAILFLASERASFITGIELCVDGGYTAI